MGSKPVRERHHRIYGSTLSSLSRTDQFAGPDVGRSNAEVLERQQESVARLSQPRTRAVGGDRSGRRATTSYSSSSAGDQSMMSLFGPMEWLYGSVTLAKEEVNIDNPHLNASHMPLTDSSCYKKVVRIIDRLMKGSGVEPVTDVRKRREITQGRYGLLFDMITTRRVILSGEPHKVGTEVYRYVAARYPQVKFAFVGITDNGSKRVARDVFYKDKLPHASADAYEKYITKSSFDVVDDNHMYIVFPENDVFINNIIAVGIEQRNLEAETRKERYWTPKYEEAGLPDFVVREAERIKMLTQQRAAMETSLRCTPCGMVSGSSPPRTPDNRRTVSPPHLSASFEGSIPSGIPSPPASPTIPSTTLHSTISSVDRSSTTHYKTPPQQHYKAVPRGTSGTHRTQHLPRELPSVVRTNDVRRQKTNNVKNVNRATHTTSTPATTTTTTAKSRTPVVSVAVRTPQTIEEADPLDTDQFVRFAEQRLQHINHTFKKRMRPTGSGYQTQSADLVDPPQTSAQSQEVLLRQAQVWAALLQQFKGPQTVAGRASPVAVKKPMMT